MRRAFLFTTLLTLWFSGCVEDKAGSRSTSPRPDPALATSAADSSARAGSEAGAAAVPVPPVVRTGADGGSAERPHEASALRTIFEGPATWRSVPREQNGYYAVLDGLCSELQASRVANGFVISYGGNAGIVVDNRRRGAASFIALRDDGLQAIGA